MIIYFINLDHRTDRLEYITKELNGLPPWLVRRIPGVQSKIKGLGCTKAHIHALELFLRSNEEVCLILEDDFQFIRSKEDLYIPQFDWDVIMLGGRLNKSRPYSDEFHRVVYAQHAAGYMVRRQFAQRLLKCFRESSRQLERGGWYETYALDVYWQKLQDSSKWFMFRDRFGIQRESYSDIEQNYVDSKE